MHSRCELQVTGNAKRKILKPAILTSLILASCVEFVILKGLVVKRSGEAGASVICWRISFLMSTSGSASWKTKHK